MKIYRLFLFGAFLFLSNVAHATYSDYIIACSGQSNMTGLSSANEWGFNSPSRTYLKVWNGDEYVIANPSENMGGGVENPCYSAAYYINKVSGKDVYMVFYAYNGQPSRWWFNDGPTQVQKDIDLEIYQATNALGRSYVDAYLWMQGESDFDFAGHYAGFLGDYIKYLRERAWWRSSENYEWYKPDTIFVAGQISVLHAPKVSADIALLSSNGDPYTQHASNVNLRYKADNIHLKNKSIIQMGVRMAIKVLNAGQ